MSIDGKTETTSTDTKQSQSQSGQDQSKETKTSAKEESGKTFTQDELNRIMAREKTQGKHAALRELGIDPKDKAAVERFKALIESQKTETQKQVETQVKENAMSIELEHRALIAEAKVEAMRLGVQPKFVEDAITLVMAKTNEGDDMKTIIGELKVKYPDWFEEIDDDTKKKEEKKPSDETKKGTGTSMKSSGPSGKESGGIGARLAAQNKSGQPKKSYWS